MRRGGNETHDHCIAIDSEDDTETREETVNCQTKTNPETSDTFEGPSAARATANTRENRIITGDFIGCSWFSCPSLLFIASTD